MYQPEVSIIIPVYNGADYLRQSIDSALGQSYQSVEVLVVNDGSTDDGASEEIARSYGDAIRYFPKANGGVSSALNLGIAQMRGAWFSWLSHDDLYHPDKILRQVETLRRLRDDGVDLDRTVLYCDTEFINADGEIILRLKPIASPQDTTKDIILKNIRQNRLGGCSFLVPKACFAVVGHFNEHIRTVSDYDFWYRLLLNDYRFHYVPETLVQGRMHARQVTYRQSELGMQEFEAFHTWLISSLFEKEEYRTSDVFLQLASSARQRGYHASSELAMSYARRLMPPIAFHAVAPWVRMSGDFTRVGKQLAKQLFVKLAIR